MKTFAPGCLGSLLLLATVSPAHADTAPAAEAARAAAQPAALERPTSFEAKAWAGLRKAGLGKRDLPPEWLVPGPRKRPAELAARDISDVTSVKTSAGATLVFVGGTTLASQAAAAVDQPARRVPFAEVWSVARGAQVVRSPLDMQRFHSASASVPGAKAGKAAKEVLVVHSQGEGGNAEQRWELWHATRPRSAGEAVVARAFVSHQATRTCAIEFLSCTAATCDGPDVEFDCPLDEAQIAAQHLGVGAWRAVVRFVQDGKGEWPSVALSRVEYGVPEAALPPQSPELGRLLSLARPEVGVLRAQQKQEARTTVRPTQRAGVICIAGKNNVTTTGPVLIVSEETPKPKGKGERVVNKGYAFDTAGTNVVAKGVLGSGSLSSQLVEIGRAGKMLAMDAETSERVTEAPATPLEYRSKKRTTTTRRLWFVSGKTFQPAITADLESHGPVLCAGDAEGCLENSIDTTWTFGEKTHHGLPDLEIVAHQVHDVMLSRTVTTRYEFDGQAWEVSGEETAGD
jgi:hypothetical protein